jgi:hypothetical protein
MSREKLERAIQKNIKEVMDKHASQMAPIPSRAGQIMENPSSVPLTNNFQNTLLPRMVEDGVSPEHYSRWKFEPITFIMANNLPYVIGNVIKYVMRYDSKDGLKDLKKAQRYIDMLIEQEYGKENV